MLRVARAALFAMVAVELPLAVLLVSGVSLPEPLVVAAELAVVVMLVLEVVTAYRLFRLERRRGATRGTAARATVDRLIPLPVRRIMAFDVKGMVSLALWVARRRHGVPPGSTPVSYAREQTSIMLMLVMLTVAELVAVEILLRSIGAPAALRTALLVLDAYGVVIVLAIIAACVTRPHVVGADDVRIRYGAFLDLRVPRERIAEVRRIRNYNESGPMVGNDGRLVVAVLSQTNLLIELTEPVTAVRPLGRHAEVRTIRFFADDPEAALTALRSLTDASSAQAAETAART